MKSSSTISLPRKKDPPPSMQHSLGNSGKGCSLPLPLLWFEVFCPDPYMDDILFRGGVLRVRGGGTNDLEEYSLSLASSSLSHFLAYPFPGHSDLISLALPIFPTTMLCLTMAQKQKNRVTIGGNLWITSQSKPFLHPAVFNRVFYCSDSWPAQLH